MPEISSAFAVGSYADVHIFSMGLASCVDPDTSVCTSSLYRV